MKLITAALLLLVLSPFQTNDEKIVWQEDRKLTWADFRGVPSGPEEYVASTNSGVSFSFSYTVRNGQQRVNYSIRSNFYPDLSWYRPEKVNDYILAHEQMHFDITELAARKLRRALAQLPKDGTFKERSEKIYNQNEADRRAMQKQYDGDSDHSNNEQEELRWRVYVAEQLDAYDAWK
ncbi:MAG: DUF922 domain-containing protein [Bacteroidota bacterium]